MLLFIPARQALVDPTIAGYLRGRPSGLPDNTNPYGVDLLLDQATGDLVVTPGGALAFVQGPENMVQALQNRMRTYPGELPLHLEYGSVLAERLIGMKAGDDELARAVATQQVAQIIASDDRFLSARNVTAAQDPDDVERVRVAAELVLAEGEALDVEDLESAVARVVVDDAGDEVTVADDEALDDPFADELDLDTVELADLLDED